ncbi:hypothetical protein, partial [Streptomyces anulatus]|uniref:hypothetical protein n=1 Tax=Streptomyces anulatus TaxID=1892 RepID=UPI00342B97C9
MQKTMTALQSETDDRSYAAAYIGILRNELYKHKIGKRTQAPTPEEIQNRTNALMGFRALAAFAGPVPVRIRNEYQWIGDKMRQYRDSYGADLGEELFLAEFPEAYVYMQSTSRNVSGIPANIESWQKSQRVKDLAAKAPDIFASAVGITDNDRRGFSDAVYNAQFAEVFNPGTGEHWREANNPYDYARQAEAGQGWRLWRKGMDMLRAELDRRGVKTFTDPAAKDLRDVKRSLAANIAEQYPAWGVEYLNPDKTVLSQRIAQAATVAGDDRLKGDVKRTDIQRLDWYVKGRDAIAKTLRERELAGGSKDLSAKANADLYEIWDKFRDLLAQDNTAFQELWLDRYFSNDYLQDVADALN